MLVRLTTIFHNILFWIYFEYFFTPIMLWYAWLSPNVSDKPGKECLRTLGYNLVCVSFRSCRTVLQEGKCKYSTCNRAETNGHPANGRLRWPSSLAANVSRATPGIQPGERGSRRVTYGYLNGPRPHWARRGTDGLCGLFAAGNYSHEQFGGDPWSVAGA